jgi:hypothetical protein
MLESAQGQDCQRFQQKHGYWPRKNSSSVSPPYCNPTGPSYYVVRLTAGLSATRVSGCAYGL